MSYKLLFIVAGLGLTGIIDEGRTMTLLLPIVAYIGIVRP
ncbi:hypothetical protein SAMN04488136_116113 [Vibrio xiamenensis]|uniref:Uncharacterized protein n=1 Tax=Vibrio xiamenensis TaxID=861298 RepID=A0A1G8CKC6_9VIBR|nr:hypothetical protein SAMN04488136_116113 [Vibrio xiamenensis]